MKRPSLVVLGEFFILMILSYSGTFKLLNMVEFRMKLLKVFYLPVELIPFISWIVPLAELVLALLLLPKSTRAGALLGMLLLFSFFTLHLVIIQLFSPGTPCSCGGLFETLSFTQHVLLNFSIILTVLLLLNFWRKNLQFA